LFQKGIFTTKTKTLNQTLIGDKNYKINELSLIKFYNKS